MRKVLSVLVTVCLVLSLFTGAFVSVPSAHALSEGDFTYSLAGTAPNQTATIIHYTGLGGVVLIPGTIGVGPYPVTSIGTGAFYLCTGLTSVTIPNSVTSIGNGSFQYCSGLISVTIGGGVVSIGTSAFSGCAELTSIIIPNGVTTIGGGAFETCTALASVTIANTVTSIGDYAFHDCTALVSIIIPSSVTTIGGGAFQGCTGLPSVTIPNSVTGIGNGAFYVCTGLTAVTIGNSVTSIGTNAFRGCTGLIAAYFVGNAPTMGTDVFAFCASGFTVWHVDGTSGWTNPWYGYPTDTVYLLTYTAGPHGSISGTLSQIVHYGADGTPVTAIPDTGYYFEQWSDGFLNAHRTDIAMDANVTVTATFSATLVLSSSWNLVSVAVPLPVASIPGLQSVFGYHDGWSVPTTLLPGEAYWVQVESAVTIPLLGTPSTAPVSLTYQAGWQLLGNPFDVPLPISSITNHALITTCYSYGPAWGVVDVTSGVLEPGKGYWILLSAATTLTLIHP